MGFRLMYGDSVAGRDYVLSVDTDQGRKYYPLNDHATQGTPEDEFAARKVAIEMLMRYHPDYVAAAQRNQFEWNGAI